MVGGDKITVVITHLKTLEQVQFSYCEVVPTSHYQAVQLGNWTLASRLADVPDFDTTLATSVDVTCGVTDGDSAHHFPVAQSVDLASMTRDARANQCVWREGHRLHLTIRTYVKRISSAEVRGDGCSVWAKTLMTSVT